MPICKSKHNSVMLVNLDKRNSCVYVTTDLLYDKTGVLQFYYEGKNKHQLLQI